MASNGIRDQVAIIGAGCIPFGERWTDSLDDMIIDAAQATYASAGIDQESIDAFWFGTAQSGMAGITMAAPLKIHGKPVTRVENYCATGSEAMRQAAYAVASGAYDVTHGPRRGEGQGLRLRRPQRLPDPHRRHPADPHRCGDVLAAAARLRRQVRRRPRRGAAGVRPGSPARTTPTVPRTRSRSSAAR